MLRSPLRKPRARHALPNRGETGRVRAGSERVDSWALKERATTGGVDTGWTETFLHRHCPGRQKGHQICDVTKYGVLGLGPRACLIKDAGGGNSLEDVSPSDALDRKLRRDRT
jgi:hypothetical protein